MIRKGGSSTSGSCTLRATAFGAALVAVAFFFGEIFGGDPFAFARVTVAGPFPFGEEDVIVAGAFPFDDVEEDVTVAAFAFGEVDVIVAAPFPFGEEDVIVAAFFPFDDDEEYVTVAAFFFDREALSVFLFFRLLLF